MSGRTTKQIIDQYRAFMNYRYQAYLTELKQLFLQLKNFGLLFLMVLGSATLGMILLLFLGLGKIIDSSDAPQYGAQMAWLYLVLQSVMLSAMKPAIKNSQQRLFQRTIVGSWWLNVMDIKLLLLSNGWLIVSAVIAFDLTFTQWLKAPHFILFMILQFSLGVLCLYKPKALLYGFVLTAALVLIPINIKPLAYHGSFAFLFLLGVLIPAFNMAKRLSVNSLMGFWLAFLINHSWVLVWRVSLLLCVFMASATLLSERTDLASIFTILALSFIVLVTSSLQFDCGNIFTHYRLFFNTCDQQRIFYISQFVPSIVLFIITMIFYMLIVGQMSFLLLLAAVIGCVLQLFFAQKKPAHYALVWVITTGLQLAFLA
ncbi:DUF6136 family protein [Pseudoalteromonas sp. S558]|uniref:DUF6136 family protein n=1 Tax=Pseudoalteromonas sp. S558 TaxID=2066515 RepID=UPI00110BA71F|nr:DUF6136 family protein [Pseudoalteromonas sp. S558]TMO01326.1 hypothetical protein CWB66_15015 [Pseudoalteromonas sp. S558]